MIIFALSIESIIVYIWCDQSEHREYGQLVVQFYIVIKEDRRRSALDDIYCHSDTHYQLDYVLCPWLQGEQPYAEGVDISSEQENKVVQQTCRA